MSAVGVRRRRSMGFSLAVAPEVLLSSIFISAASRSSDFITDSRFFNGKPRSAIRLLIREMTFTRFASLCNARRKAFSERVCELTGAINAYDHIKVSGERLAVHENRKVSEKKITKVQVIEFDEEFFKGKNCICFDDVLTSGKSWAAFGHKLEEFGANVVAGFFLSKTTYKVA